MIKPIETIYKGYRFRSRLEARWAVFFDALDIKWQYELEGFEKVEDMGNGRIETIRYLPDFYLPKTETWVEVKGTPEALANEADKLGKILDWGSPLPGINDSFDNNNYSIVHGLLILYDIPSISWHIVLHPIITQYKGLSIQYVMFIGKELIKLNDGQLDIIEFFTREKIPRRQFFDGYSYGKDDWIINQYLIESHKIISSVFDAYSAARQARFEHGENG